MEYESSVATTQSLRRPSPKRKTSLVALWSPSRTYVSEIVPSVPPLCTIRYIATGRNEYDNNLSCLPVARYITVSIHLYPIPFRTIFYFSLRLDMRCCCSRFIASNGFGHFYWELRGPHFLLGRSNIPRTKTLPFATFTQLRSLQTYPYILISQGYKIWITAW